MSFVIAAPEMVTDAATTLASIGSTIGEANAAAAAPTTGVLAVAGDEVSAAVASLFSGHAQAYQALSTQATAFHAQFVQALNGAGGLYAATEAANASPLQNLPTMAANAMNNLGYGNIGANNTGLFNNGYYNTGIGNTGYDNLGIGNLNPYSPYNINVPRGNTGLFNNGLAKGGLWNTGFGQIGIGNTGSTNIGIGLNGNGQIGIGPLAFTPTPTSAQALPTMAATAAQNIGYGNTGSGNVGFFNTGSNNIGFFNSGTGNFGVDNTGRYNTGFPTGLGLGNNGSYNQGILNTGNYNDGAFNSGYNNIGFGLTGSNLFGIGPLIIPNPVPIAAFLGPFPIR